MSETINATPTTPEATETTPAAPLSAGERMLNSLNKAAPPAEPAPATEPATDGEPVVATEQVAEPSWLDRLKDMGFQDVQDEEEAKQRVLDALRQTQLRAEEADRLAQERAELLRLRELERQQAQPQNQATTPHTEPPKPWEFQPVSDELLESYRTVSTDDTGKEVVSWSAATPPQVRQQYEHYERSRKQWANRLINEPAAVFQEMFDHYLPQYVTKQLEQVTTQQQQQSFIEKFETDNPWLFASDPLTKQRTGFSAEGQQFAQFMREAKDFGIQDIQKQIAYAERMRKAELATRQASQANVSLTNQSKKSDLLQRGAGNPPSQGGSLPADTAVNARPQNPALSPGERFLEKARASGVAIHP